MTSSISKRAIAGAVGFIYAVLYGFWTMLITGGGHGNFIWLFLFITIEFVGLYFPLMTVIAVDLRRRATKIIFGSLIGFNLIGSTIMILGWVNDTSGERQSDFSRMVQMNGFEWILTFAAVHFFPTVIFLFLLIRSILLGSSLPDEEPMINLNLS